MKAAAIIATMSLAGCTGTDVELGLDQPLRVPSARYVEGALPGLPPDDNAARIDPAVTTVETPNNVVRLGQTGKELSGRTSTDAVAIAIAFAEYGDGYWVSPLGPPDPTAGNELTWKLDTTIGWDVPIGLGAIDVVAIDEDGTAGRQYRTSVCVRPDLLDNFATCDESLSPPDTVIALSWDTTVDLDLAVRTPGGKLVDPGSPSTIAHPPPITATELAADGVGILDRDSNGNCRIDAINREALVFKTKPPAGTYVVYANLSNACGQASVRFSAIVYRASEEGGVKRLVEVARQDGRLRADDADGGRGPGLFLLQLAL